MDLAEKKNLLEGVDARTRLAGLDEFEHPLDIGLRETPGTHVVGLFLAPHEFRLLEARQDVDQRLVRPRVELFDA